MQLKSLHLPWHPVPAYKGAKGPEGQPHVVDANGELVGVFELMEHAEITARAVNLSRPLCEDSRQKNSNFYDLTEV